MSAQTLAGTPLAHYSAYYAGIAYLNLARAAEARTVFAKLRSEKPAGFLVRGCGDARGRDGGRAGGLRRGGEDLRGCCRAGGRRTPDAVLLALGRALASAGDKAHAAETFARLYYEFPLSDLAATAATELDGLKDLRPVR